MADLPPQWTVARNLIEGGQGHIFVVQRSDKSDSNLYVLKRLKNPNRRDYFEREIEVCTTLDHPNILKVLEHGETPKGKPFLITAYCGGGSLNDSPKFSRPSDGLTFFQQIVAGVAHAQAHQPPIYHLDLKPENILLTKDAPVVGDFRICFVEANQLSLTSEGPRGSVYYCAPELRGPKIQANPMLAAADTYSLGKVLYWLFTHEVYDGHEEDYGSVPDRQLAHLFPTYPQFAFIDELISSLVRRNPAERIANASDLDVLVQQVADRIEAGGRVLDLRVPQRCLYCAVGAYRPGHEQVHTMGHPQPGLPRFPEIEKRRVPEPRGQPEKSAYGTIRATATVLFGSHSMADFGYGMPLFLICDYCGNIQLFRLDWTSDGHGEHWRP